VRVCEEVPDVLLPRHPYSKLDKAEKFFTLRRECQRFGDTARGPHLPCRSGGHVSHFSLKTFYFSRQ
jgi:hypothetical protein